jgi:dTDP-4-dehydrorhamnose reductase
MKLLVYGHKGWIGSMFINILNEKNIEYYTTNTRCDNYADLINDLNNTKPTHVISFIGRTHGEIDGKTYSTIDYLEEPGKLKENINDNLFSPLQLALLCNERNIHYTYLGTGCIFSYRDGIISDENGFKESDLPNFFGSQYSTVKGFTDKLINLIPNTLNLRIRMPIVNYDNPRNFITKITKYSKICSIPNSMTVLTELLPYIINLIKINHTGTLNFTNPGSISHNEILEMYKEYVDPKFTWKNFTMEEQNNILKSERSNNLLDTTCLEQLFPNIKNIKDSLKFIFIKYNKE